MGGFRSFFVRAPVEGRWRAELRRRLNRMLIFINTLVLILIALLAVPFLVAVALFLLLFDLAQFPGRLLRRFRQGKEHLDAVDYPPAATKGEPRTMKEGKILIIQSASPSCVLKGLERLNGMQRFRNSHRTLFCRNRSEVLKHFAGQPMFDRVISHSETQAWWEHFKRFRRERFDAVIAFFTGEPSYWKIKYFAFLLGGREKFLFDENNNCVVLSLRTSFRLFERDLIFFGIFQANAWKINRALRWLAERYRMMRARALVPVARHVSGHDFSAVDTSPVRQSADAEPPDAAPYPMDRQSRLNDAKQMLASLSDISLRSFLSSQARFRVPQSPEPEISVILVLYNRAELTLQCLRSLAEGRLESLEIIIVDNASSDATPSLLNRIDGATIVRNSTNIHFLKAANQGARQARGRYVLFLNNDAQVLPGSIEAAAKTIASSDDIGAVGGKIILPDGLLQEAGCIVWKDGSCLGYGRGDDPFAPYYMFRRDVDYCSGAFLLTRREDFIRLGGFDEAYQPFYYEETDYCLRLWEHGLRVVFEPDATILHYEFASSPSSEIAQEWHARHQGHFLHRHRDWLQSHHEFSDESILEARSVGNHCHRVLFIDDRIPHSSLGSGFPRSNAIVSNLAKLGCCITFYPTAVIDEEWSDVYIDIPREVEVMIGYGPSRLDRFLASRAGYYDLILISRPHNMQYVRPIFQAHADLFRNTKIIYDAEALFSFRDIAYQKLKGETLSARSIEQLTKSEVELADIADLVVSVSEAEANAFTRYGIPKIRVLGHALSVLPTPRAFRERSGFLFVGSILEENSPNGDAVLWFVKEILPIIRHKLGGVPFTIAGINNIDINAGSADGQLRILGRVEDLTAFYDEARVFVAPTRFAAGIPHKIHEAAARGVPVVATPLLACQLGWQDGEHLLAADDPNAFADRCIRLYSDAQVWEHIRQNALERIRSECSHESFAATLKSILDGD